jgi:glycosyltransferase involved in cell wall biosynthesis
MTAAGPVRIFVNASSARLGGGQTYLRNILAHIPQPQLAQVYLLADASLALPSMPANLVRLPVPSGLHNPLLRAFWEKVRLPQLLRELQIDVLFCPGGVIGTRAPRGCRTVTMFRNMLPFDEVQLRRHPLIWPRLRVMLLRRVMSKSMQSADLVIFVSRWAREQIRRALGKPLRNDAMIYHGLDADFRRPSAAQPPRPTWLPERPYFAYVSLLEFYKSQVEVVRAFAIFRQRTGADVALVLAGGKSSAYADEVVAEIERQGLRDHVLMPGNVAHQELPALYANASALIFASQCENCPNILLESLAAGRPVLSSQTQPMPEFGADAALYFDPLAPESLAEQLVRVHENPQFADEMARRALLRSQDFDWSATSERTWQLLIDTPPPGMVQTRIGVISEETSYN